MSLQDSLAYRLESKTKIIVLEDENARLKELIQCKDELIEQLTNRITKILESQQKNKNHTKKRLSLQKQLKITKKPSNIEQCIKQLHQSLKQHSQHNFNVFNASLTALQQKYEQQLKTIRQAYDSIIRSLKQQNKSVIHHNKNQQITHNNLVARNQQILSQLHLIRRQYEQVLDEYKIKLTKYERDIEGLQADLKQQKQQKQLMSEQIKNLRRESRQEQLQLQEERRTWQQQIENVKQQCDTKLKEARDMSKYLENRQKLTERALQNRPKIEMPPKIVIQKTDNEQLCQQYRKVIVELEKSIQNKDHQIECLSQRVRQFEKVIEIDVPVDVRLEKIKECSGGIRNLYDTLKKEIKSRVK